MEFSSYLQTSVLADEVQQTGGADLIMLYGSNGKVSVLRNDRAIDCAQIAKYLRDGGGHPIASGGRFWGHPKNSYQVIEGLESFVCKVL
jgi:oligoribonuclease NrnB/cAMP/cGMP phosphodiesterase (DHH superfamily)